MTCPLVGCILQSIPYDIQSQPNGPFSAFKSAFADLFLYSSPRWVWADTSTELVPACATWPSNQRRGNQYVGILLSSLIENRLRTRGYCSQTIFWRVESQSTECPPGLHAVWPLDLLSSMYACRVSNTLHKLTDVSS